LPRKIDLRVHHFVTRVIVSDSSGQLSANVIQTVQPDHIETTVPVILDIDVFESGPFSPKAEVLLPRFPALRIFKNKMFFSSLTEEAVSFFT